MSPPSTSTTTMLETAEQTDTTVLTYPPNVAENPNLAADAQLYDAVPPTFEDKYEERAFLKQRLALAFRIFAKYGFCEGAGGHITVRDPVDHTTFWLNPFGMHFALIKSSDLIQANHKGEVIAGGRNRKINKAGFLIHAAIHEARHDVLCAAHAHGIHGRAFCALGKRLECITQDHCSFHNDLALYEEYGGVVLDPAEGQKIADCLGGCKAALLVNHGALTVGKSIEEAVFWFVTLERNCQVQLLADAAGETKKIGDAEAAFNYSTMGTTQSGWFSGLLEFDLAEYEAKGEHLL